jgi:hypothetical protein
MGSEGYAVLGSQDYGIFIQHLWMGQYNEAIKEGEGLLLKLKTSKRVS